MGRSPSSQCQGGAFEARIGEAGALALFDVVSEQILKKGFIARGGWMIDATLVPALKQSISRKEKEIIQQQATSFTDSEERSEEQAAV